MRLQQDPVDPGSRIISPRQYPRITYPASISETHYFHQYLTRIPWNNLASSSVKEALLSSTQHSISKSFLYSFYFIEGKIIFINTICFSRRIHCAHPTSISQSTYLIMLLFLFPYLNVTCYCLGGILSWNSWSNQPHDFALSVLSHVRICW